MSEILSVNYKTAPVEVEGTSGRTHRLEIDLGSGVGALETYDPGDNNGTYTLTLGKEVTNLADVRPTHNELLDLLTRYSLVWTFSGGAPMKLQTDSVRTSPGYTTNAEVVEESLRSKAGLSRVSSSIDTSYMVFAKYSAYPLAKAIELARAVDSDFHLRLMLEYLQQARFDERAWFIHLYKVRDTIKNAAKKPKPDKKRSGVKNTPWSNFGLWLNDEYDLRHARKREDNAATIDSAKKSELFRIGADMISKYMDSHGISHL